MGAEVVEFGGPLTKEAVFWRRALIAARHFRNSNRVIGENRSSTRIW